MQGSPELCGSKGRHRTRKTAVCEERAPSGLQRILPGFPEESPLPVGLLDGCQVLGVRDREQQREYKGSQSET